MSGLATAIVVSELVALLLIWRVWRSPDPILLRIAVSLIALIPFIGPFFALWIGHFPNPLPHVLRDKHRYWSDVFDRWISVLSTKNPRKKYERWLAVRAEKHDDR